MKINSMYLLLIVISGNYIFSQNTPSDTTLKNHPGIPLISYTYGFDQWKTVTDWENADASGIFALEVLNINNTDYTNFLSNTNFKIVADQGEGIANNFINKYTDARYSVWEAEGTPEQDGKATLYRDLNHTSRVDTTIVTTNPPKNTKILYGPSYIQEINYSGVDVNDIVNFTAAFKMKLDVIDPQNFPLPTDTICILRIYMSKIPRITGVGYDTTRIFTIDSVLTFNKLKQYWDEYYINYDLEAAWDYLNPEPIAYDTNLIAYRVGFNQGTIPIKKNVENLEYQIIWKGDASKVRLHIDKVTLMDARGKDLFDTNLVPSISDLIVSQLIEQTNFQHRVVGWLGIDEPIGIDCFAPIKRVNEIVESAGSTMWIAFINWFYGRFWDPGHPMFTANLVRIDEFMRRVKKANIWMNYYMFDWPFSSTFDPIGGDWRVNTIDAITDSCYSHYIAASQLPGVDLFWGASVQTGRIEYPIYGGADYWREIKSHELLYTTNLALLYGAKLISPWLFFGGGSGEWVYTGFLNPNPIPPINPYLLSDKYYTLKDTLVPRLNGLMGKTLKNLDPYKQYAGSNGISYSYISWDHNPNGYEYIEDVIPTETVPSENEYGLEMGFFSDPVASYKDYFMILNRYYSQVNKYTIKLRQLSGFNNWNLSNYVDTTNITLIALNANATFQDTILKGDANLYSISPVVKSGGKLIVNETVSDGTTLYEDMLIENGATLTINGTYNAKANITVKNGGKIVAGTNGKIIFDPYKKLIVETTTEIKGTSPINKLTLEFVNSEKGIDVLPGSSLALSYCSITGAYYGLVTRTGMPSYLNITHSNFAFGSTGIVLNGNFYGEGSSPSPTSTISGCNFTTWGTGISVSNNSAVIISQNNFTSCGISILNVPSAYIQSNSIYSGSNQSYSGIFFNNSGGYIRNNLVKNRVNGIQLANSSPDIGGNILENNYLHGLYIGTGSIPNLVGLVQTNPPTYYALAGYNTIFNNGNNTQANTENDGSEIYFSYSDAYLGTEKFPGCNEISDDRTSTSSMNTVLLLGGYYYNEPHYLDAIYNYWGTTTPYNDRFAIATNYSPYSDKPCSPNGGGEEEMLLATLSGEVIDTIKSAEGIPLELTVLEASYSEADNLFATGNVTQAKPLYEQIVSGNHTAEEKLSAYNKLYTIGNLTGEDENYFNSLQSTFEDIANNEADTLIKKVYGQNAIKCDVSKEEYLTAISKFDNIIQQNPNSEEAIYAEIDIITTALNLDTTNSQLGKMGGGKYLVKGTSDYLTKLNNILQNKFGINSEEKEQIIPKEYSLYQNYPNPFNPTTTIKFDLPQDGLVSLEIYDILGRRITTLINENRSAGSFEQVFNASSLASGIYIYKIQAGDYINSKKMLLIK